MNHALLSPSSAHRWLRCPAAPTMEAMCPETYSAYAEEGTRAHLAAAEALNGHPLTCDDPEMRDAVQAYVDIVREMAGDAALFIETSVSIEHLTGELGAAGTPDLFFVTDDGELVVTDLKYGRKPVSAADNPQLMIAALAIVKEYAAIFEIHSVRGVIVQPRISRVSEWTYTWDVLNEFEIMVDTAAAYAQQLTTAAPEELYEAAQPSAEACQYCRAKATCRKLADFVFDTVTEDGRGIECPVTVVKAAVGRTLDNTTLAGLLPQLDLIEDWTTSIRERAIAELQAGHPVPGYKLVAGRQGNRAWTDKEAAEQAMKSMRLKLNEMYTHALINPTAAEALAKGGTISERQWARLQPLITRAPGKPALAPESDKRPAIKAAIDDFE